jgi:hypothetical protein
MDFLFSGIAGAVLAVLGTIGYTEVKEARQRSRQRSGLARLLHAEILRNSPILKDYDVSYIIAPDAVIPRTEIRQREVWHIQEMPPVKLDAWQESRATITSLLPKKDFDAVEVYYRELESLLDTKPSANEETAKQRARTEAENKIRNIEACQLRATEALEKYLRTPRY